MTKPNTKRDNRYYLDRLRDEHPGHYADYQAGKFKNVTEALRVAGLRKQRGGFEVLQSAWNKASATEKNAFKVLIGCVASTTSAPGPVATATSGLAGNTPAVTQSKRRLSPTLATAVSKIMDRRGLKIGAIMREMGLNPRDTSLGMALCRDTQVRDDLVAALESWVQEHNSF